MNHSLGKGKKQGANGAKKKEKGGKNNEKNKDDVDKDVASGGKKQGKHLIFLIIDSKKYNIICY